MTALSPEDLKLDDVLELVMNKRFAIEDILRENDLSGTNSGKAYIDLYNKSVALLNIEAKIKNYNNGIY